MTADTTLRIERTFHAPAQAACDAWTSEEVLRRWWHAAPDWRPAARWVGLRIGRIALLNEDLDRPRLDRDDEAAARQTGILKCGDRCVERAAADAGSYTTGR